MADDRISKPNIPAASPSYDAQSEAAFRREVEQLYIEVDTAMQRLLTSIDSTNLAYVNVNNSFSVNQTILISSGTAELNITGTSAVLTLSHQSTGTSQVRFERAGEFRWIFILEDDDDDADNDGADLYLQAYDDTASSLGRVFTVERDPGGLGPRMIFENDLGFATGARWKEGDLLADADVALQLRGASAAPGNGNDFGAALKLGVGTNSPRIVARQLGGDSDVQGMVFYMHPSSTSGDAAVEAMLLDTGIGTDETCLWLRHNAGGSGVTFEQVTIGAADSGGSGFRVLRIPN